MRQKWAVQSVRKSDLRPPCRGRDPALLGSQHVKRELVVRHTRKFTSSKNTGCFAACSLEVTVTINVDVSCSLTVYLAKLIERGSNRRLHTCSERPSSGLIQPINAFI